MRLRSICFAATLLAVLPGCTVAARQLKAPGLATVVTTPDVGRSMIYLARTDSGVIVIDLGWVDAPARVRAGLRQLGAEPEEVTDVFLTHSHRDHIRGWRAVRGARFHLGIGDVATFLGRASLADRPSRLAAAVFPHAYPVRDSLDVRPFGRDTVYVLGRDTLRAFLVPGHTAGSAAYLFRGVLFVGDALAYHYLRGFGYTRRALTRDMKQNRASVASLRERVAPYRVEVVCTAHAKCARPARLRRKLAG
jgi:glyoxylase-like metal-dependent hydrolase (beta-lactamase superfamily II)